MSTIEVGLDGLDRAVWRDLLADAALHAARDPGFAERFERDAGMGVRARLAWHVAVWCASHLKGAEAVPVWPADEVCREARERVVTAGRGF